MRRTELEIIKRLTEGSFTLGSLALAIGKSKSWTSELVKGLEKDGLVMKEGNEVKLSSTYGASLLSKISERYDPARVLGGKKEDILGEIVERPKKSGELEKQGYSKSTSYKAIKELKLVGVIKNTSKGWEIVDDLIRDFIRSRRVGEPDVTEYTSADERIIKTRRNENNMGHLTAFSSFTRYDIEYFPKRVYLYLGNKQIDMAQVLIHAVKFSENKKQMAMTAIFYLKHKVTLDISRIWKLAHKWDCVENWADLLAFLDHRQVRNETMFPAWDEFASLAREYGIELRDKYPENRLLKGLKHIGQSLESGVTIYLLGGFNLILRDIKDSTKDIDVVVEDKKEFTNLVKSLKKLGYVETRDLENAYKKMNPKMVFEKHGHPRWDIFVKMVANKLHLTEGMKNRSEDFKKFGKLTIRLVSPTDMLLFKSVTDREGDLEDVGLIVRKEKIYWDRLLEEIKIQERITERYFSFIILDTLEIIRDRYDIYVPVQKKLVSLALEKSLLLALEDGAKTIIQLKKYLDFPEHSIYNKLRKLENIGIIEVDRRGKINTYKLSDGKI